MTLRACQQKHHYFIQSNNKASYILYRGHTEFIDNKFLSIMLLSITISLSDCWLSHDKDYQYTAAGIIFDNTRFKDAVKHNFGGGVPDYENRNLKTQYWIFWPREAASKGRFSFFTRKYDIVL